MTKFCIESGPQDKRSFWGYGDLAQAQRNWTMLSEKGLNPGPIRKTKDMNGHWTPAEIVRTPAPVKTRYEIVLIVNGAQYRVIVAYLPSEPSEADVLAYVARRLPSLTEFEYVLQK